jgi:hypothetical protein
MHSQGLSQFADDLSSASLDDLLHRMNNPAPGPDSHSQQLVDRIDLDPHEFLAVTDGAIDLTPVAGDSDQEPEGGQGDRARAGQTQRKSYAEAGDQHHRHCGHLSKSVRLERLVVIEGVVEAGLAQSKLGGGAFIAIEPAPEPGRQRGQEHPRDTHPHRARL